MQKFIDQFNLRPGLAVALEQTLFSFADEKVQGYRGGVWEEKEVRKGVFITLIPFRGEETFTMSSAYSDVEADHITVSAAVSAVAVNWFWHRNAAIMTDAENKAMQKYYDAMRAVVFGKKKDHGINSDKYFTLTD